MTDKQPLVGNIAGPRRDRGFWLDLALALGIVLAWALLYADHRRDRDDRRLATLRGARTELDRLETAMDTYYGKALSDLRGFDDWPARGAGDTLTGTTLVRPFVPFVRRNPYVGSVRIANEFGDQWMLTDLDTTLLVTEHCAADSSISRWSLGADGRTEEPLPQVDAPWTDVRSLPWFGAALGARRTGPRWGNPYPLPGAGGLGLTTSLAVRNDTGEVTVRVLAFDVRLFDPDQVLSPTSASEGPWLFVLDGDGKPLLPEEPLARAKDALTEWDRLGRPRHVWTLVDNLPMALVVQPYTISGLDLHIGALAPLLPLSPGSVVDRNLHWLQVGALALLTGLLIAAYRRRRRESEQHRAQQERSRSQRQRLAKAIGEREVLNREVHHRVKNNLQVVTSLLNLQLRKLEEGPVKDEFQRGVRRIDNMAIVHHKLYGLQDLRGIGLQHFFTDLVTNIASTTGDKGTTVSCAVDTDNIKADADTAIELGVILCELVGNCYQHAFPYATGGHIEVSVRRVEGDLYRLVVKDNGQGLDGHPLEGTGKMGLEVVEALAFQLDGNLKVTSSGGVTFDVLFRMAKPVHH